MLAITGMGLGLWMIFVVVMIIVLAAVVRRKGVKPGGAWLWLGLICAAAVLCGATTANIRNAWNSDGGRVWTTATGTELFTINTTGPKANLRLDDAPLPVVDYVTTTSARTITAEECRKGTVFTVSAITGADAADDIVTFALPAAATGLKVTVIDADADANNDVWITAATGDKINGGTAAKSYKCTGDAVKQHVTLVARDATNWEVVAESGTWANDNS